MNRIETVPGTDGNIPASHNQAHGFVQGKIVDADGAPMSGIRIVATAKNFRSEKQIGEAITSQLGEFSIPYIRTGALNLLIRAYDTSGRAIAQSATIFKAAAETEVNLTTASDGVIRTPSTFTKIQQSIAVEVDRTSLSKVDPIRDILDLHFIAGVAGIPFEDVACYWLARTLSAENKISEETFFGILSQDIPLSASTDVRKLSGDIDAAFVDKVLTGILAHSREILRDALAAAVKANVIPPSYAARQASELTLIDAFRAERIGRRPYGPGNTSLNDLLSAGGINEVLKASFTKAYADRNGHLESTWHTIRATGKHAEEDLAALDITLSAGELLGGNVPLVKDTISRLSDKTLESIQHLALLDEDDWAARVTAADPEATSIPEAVPAEAPTQRTTRFARELASRFATEYPTTAFAGRLSKAQHSSFEKTK